MKNVVVLNRKMGELSEKRTEAVDLLIKYVKGRLHIRFLTEIAQVEECISSLKKGEKVDLLITDRDFYKSLAKLADTETLYIPENNADIFLIELEVDLKIKQRRELVEQKLNPSSN